MNRKRKIQDCLIICLLLVIIGCGSVEKSAIQVKGQIDIIGRYNHTSRYYAAYLVKTVYTINNPPEDIPEEDIIEDMPYEGTGQLEEDITEQIRTYVKQREVWFEESEPFRRLCLYTLNDINMDGTLDLISSYCAGTGYYSSSYVYTINAEGEVEKVESISGDFGGIPDLTWGMDLYVDAGEESPEHFYIRSIDYTPDGPYGHNDDMVITFSADMTDWRYELLREHEVKRWDDDSLPEDVYHYNRYNESGEREWVEISQREWEQLEEEFLKGKELILSDFEWSSLRPAEYTEGEAAVSNRELGEALEELYLESIKQDE